jgi:hypothetical protein
MELGFGLFTSSFAQAVLVFVLVFALVFAILQRSKLLGEGKGQVEVLIAGSTGLLILSAGYALDIITSLIPFLAVSLVVILVFVLLIGLFFEKEFKPSTGMRNTAIVVALLAVAIALLNFTNSYQTIVDWIGNNDSVVGNVVLIGVVIGAIALALRKEE